jgi:hypothetical protein
MPIIRNYTYRLVLTAHRVKTQLRAQWEMRNGGLHCGHQEMDTTQQPHAE